LFRKYSLGDGLFQVWLNWSGETLQACRARGHLADRRPAQHLPETGLTQRPVQSQAQDRKSQGTGQGEHPFRVIKRQFGAVKTRFRGLTKDTAQLVTLFALFALSNLWIACRHFLSHAMWGVAAARCSQRLKTQE
jgi:hypothetical protein